MAEMILAAELIRVAKAPHWTTPSTLVTIYENFSMDPTSPTEDAISTKTAMKTSTLMQV